MKAKLALQISLPLVVAGQILGVLFGLLVAAAGVFCLAIGRGFVAFVDVLPDAPVPTAREVQLHATATHLRAIAEQLDDDSFRDLAAGLADLRETLALGRSGEVVRSAVIYRPGALAIDWWVDPAPGDDEAP